MKKLSKDEFNNLDIRFRGRERQNPKFWKEICLLKLGEHLFIEPKDFKYTGKKELNSAVLSGIINSYTYQSKRSEYQKSRMGKLLVGKKFSIATLADKSGWVITRVN